MFGEVFDGNPAYMSQYTTTGKLPATLDFGFQGAALGFAQGKATTGVRDLFAGDDYYTDTDSNAYELPTFLGNHDMGRVGAMLLGSDYDNADEAKRQNLLDRAELANSLMFLTRGNPVVYYGDEQGFTGPASGFDDKRARQDMFGSQTADLPGRRRHRQRRPAGHGCALLDRSRRSTSTSRPLAALRQANPALADGAQVHRYASDAAGIYAFSRIDKAAKREYVVATNNATTAKSATFETYSAGAKLVPLLGGSGDLRADKAGRVTVTLPPLSVAVYRANATMASSSVAPTVYPTSPSAGGVVGGRAEIGAAVPANTFAEVSFLYRPVGTSDLDPDRHRRQRALPRLPRRQRHRQGHPARVPHGRQGPLRPRLGHVDLRRRRRARRPPAVAAAAASAPSPSRTRSASPAATTREMGCPGDWQPDCAQAQLALDAKDDIWKGTWTDPGR